MKEKLFALALLLLYIGSLFLPGLVLEPRVQDNPKHELCACPMTEGYVMDRETRGCGLKDRAGIKNPMSEDEVYAICGDDWNTPVATDMKGYNILFVGWAGIAELNFAWFANVCFFFGLFAFVMKQYKDSFNFSLAAIPLAISAFSFSGIRNIESGTYTAVDHLGSGYFLWLFVIVALAVYTYVVAKKSINEKVELSSSTIIYMIIGLILLTAPGVYSTHQRIEIEKQREQSEKISEEKRAQSKLIPFVSEFRKDNYKVTVSDKTITYYEKGTLVRVETLVNNNVDKIYLQKEGNIYVIDAQKNLYTETNLNSNDSTKLTSQMEAASFLPIALRAEKEILVSKWNFEGNSQFYTEELFAMRLEFNPETNLLTKMEMDITEDGKSQEVIVQLDYEKIDDQRLEALKSVSSEYKKAQTF